MSGECILHTDNLYVMFGQSALGPGYGFMYRSCKHRKDYTGGPNKWMPWERLTDLQAVANTMKRPSFQIIN